MITIYALAGDDGRTFYVGKTNDQRRRLREHKRRLGYVPTLTVLQVCDDDSWPEAEAKWIDELRSRGFDLINRMAGDAKGVQTHSEETRRKLSLIGKGRPKPPGFGERLSAATKGRPHNWSPDGRARAARGQFKAGDNSHWRAADDEKRARWLANLTIQTSEKISADQRRIWASLTPERRAEISRQRSDSAKASWARRKEGIVG